MSIGEIKTVTSRSNLVKDWSSFGEIKNLRSVQLIEEIAFTGFKNRTVLSSCVQMGSPNMGRHFLPVMRRNA